MNRDFAISALREGINLRSKTGTDRVADLLKKVEVLGRRLHAPARRAILLSKPTYPTLSRRRWTVVSEEPHRSRAMYTGFVVVPPKALLTNLHPGHLSVLLHVEVRPSCRGRDARKVKDGEA